MVNKVQAYNGTLLIGDEDYFGKSELKKYVVEENLTNMVVVVETTTLEDEDLVVAKVHFYPEGKPQAFKYDLAADVLQAPKGVNVATKELGCDCASFIMKGVNWVKFSTLSDGCYGYMYKMESGEILISLFITTDAITAAEFEKNIKYALGLVVV